LIPKRHVPSYFDLNEQELIRLQGLIEDQKNLILKEDKEVTAFNIGINDGIDAGQTILHSHIHLIPRRAGDVENPRGGVRGVIPEKQNY
jgi:diadenosine tetraphosphate (Ap4A) HIT family hydrolase